MPCKGISEYLPCNKCKETLPLRPYAMLKLGCTASQKCPSCRQRPQLPSRRVAACPPRRRASASGTATSLPPCLLPLRGTPLRRRVLHPQTPIESWRAPSGSRRRAAPGRRRRCARHGERRGAWRRATTRVARGARREGGACTAGHTVAAASQAPASSRLCCVVVPTGRPCSPGIAALRRTKPPHNAPRPA